MALSGQKTVTTAQGLRLASFRHTQQIGAPLMVKALPSNTGLVYVGEIVRRCVFEHRDAAGRR